MPVPLVRVHSRDQIYSPFSGQLAESNSVPNKKDPTLLFVYHGETGFYTYVSQRLMNSMNEDIEYLDAEALHTHIDIEGGLILEVETDVRGVNYYGFAPAE